MNEMSAQTEFQVATGGGELQAIHAGVHASDQPIDPFACYSIEEAATLLGKGQTWVKDRKKYLLQVFTADKARVVQPNGSLNAFGLDQLRAMIPYAQIGDLDSYSEAVWSEFPELRPSDEAVDAELLQDGSGSDAEYVSPLANTSLTIYQAPTLELHSAQFAEDAGLAIALGDQSLEQQFRTTFGALDDLFETIRTTAKTKVVNSYQRGIAEGLQEIQGSAKKHSGNGAVNVNRVGNGQDQSGRQENDG